MFLLNKFFILILTFLQCLGFFVFQIPEVKAENFSVVINELMWMGTSKSTADEFIELRNLTDQAIDLSGWNLTRMDSGAELVMLQIPQGAQILPKGYFLISNYGINLSQINASPDVADTAVNLSNTNLQIKLYNGPFATSQLIDVAGNGQLPLSGNKELFLSMERNWQITDGSLAQSWHNAEKTVNFKENSIEFGSPKNANSDFVINSEPIQIEDPVLPIIENEEPILPIIDLENPVFDPLVLNLENSTESNNNNLLEQENTVNQENENNLLIEPIVEEAEEELPLLLAEEIILQKGQLMINEFSLNEINDFVEIKVMESGNYENLQIYYGEKMLAEIPTWQLEQGDYIALRSDKNLENDILKQNNDLNFWEIFFDTNLLAQDNFLMIKNKSTGEVIDSVYWANQENNFNYLNSANIEQGMTFSRNEDLDNSWNLSEEITMGRKNVLPNNEVENIVNFEPSMIVINEIVSDPTVSVEWVELYSNIDQEIDLTGWILEEGSGKRTVLSGVIGPQNNYLVFNKSSLNNSGDVIYLKSPDEKIIDQVAYGDFDDGDISDNALSAVKGYSLARKIDGQDTDVDNTDFLITQTITKNAVNVIYFPIVEQDAVSIPIAVQNTDNSVQNNIYSDKIKINEVFPNPEGADDEEFIELKNIGSQKINLSGWKIGDASKSVVLTNEKYSNLEILPNQFLVIEKSDSGISLNNTGSEKVILYNPNNEISDQIQYSALDTENLSYSLINGVWQWTETVTQGQENIFTISEEDQAETESQSVETEDPALIEKDYDFSNLIITEIYPNPQDGEIEFIEIYNLGNEKINMQGLYLDDIDGGSKPYLIPETFINPKQYLIFENDLTKIVLNNSGDSARLLDFENKVLQQVDYLDSPKGQSYSFIDNKWVWTEKVTPQKENILQITPVEKKTTLASSTTNKTVVKKSTTTKANTYLASTLENVRNLALKTKVKVKGIVSVEPKVLGKNIFYLKGSGIQVYFSKADFPDLKLGDEVEISGTLSESNGEKRILLAAKEDISIISQNQISPEPKETKINEIGENLEGYLVKIKGDVMETKANIIYLADETGEAQVNIKESTGIKKELKEGDKAEIVGIISQSGDKYYVLPRYQGDMVKIEKKIEAGGELIQDREVSSSGGDMRWMYFGVSALFLLGLGGYFVYKYRGQKSQITSINGQ